MAVSFSNFAKTMNFAKTLALGLGLFAAASAHSADQADQAPIARGKAVAIEGDCAACHTATGHAPLAGGRAIDSPMGAIIAPNITPSKTAGIGGYTLEQFDRALRKGIARDGAYLYPAMPYPAYVGMTDEDVKALYVYLMNGVAPVDTPPAAKTALRFPFNQRWLMAGWDLLYGVGPHGDDASLTAEQQRGRYLVDTLGHCSTCHTPRGLMMNEERGNYLAGGEVGGWKAPNITADPIQGIGGWSEEQLVNYLRNGRAEGRDAAAGPMAEAIEHSFSQLPDSDLRAIAAYLKQVPARAPIVGQNQPDYAWTQARLAAVHSDETGFDATAANIADYQHVTDGAALYGSACASCHGDRGEGRPGAYPSLTASTTVGSRDASNLILTIAEGIDRHDASGQTVMPAFGRDMSDRQIAAVANYVTRSFGNPEVTIDSEQVRLVRAGGPTPWIVGNVNLLMGIAIALLIVACGAAVAYRRARRAKHVKAG